MLTTTFALPLGPALSEIPLLPGSGDKNHRLNRSDFINWSVEKYYCEFSGSNLIWHAPVAKYYFTPRPMIPLTTTAYAPSTEALFPTPIPARWEFGTTTILLLTAAHLWLLFTHLPLKPAVPPLPSPTFELSYPAWPRQSLSDPAPTEATDAATENLSPLTPTLTDPAEKATTPPSISPPNTPAPTPITEPSSAPAPAPKAAEPRPSPVSPVKKRPSATFIYQQLSTLDEIDPQNLGDCEEMLMECTAYTHDGSRTATGVVPQYGIVAVDPRVIPLGTRLYVVGYGPAVAADTGGLIKGKRIDIFLNSETECRKWGRRKVKVYVIQRP